ncbi:AraC family transcriptional regulator [Parabacteroides sp. AF17-3]|uniref:AraC family transcriptional regulator n=1 Tax=Parabacteroides sp. AF17-3 TaxID=2293113 RepID=UPI000EFF6308|nr:AraC family transcriptional regulator [Parabacteroides sp. AF17-3]RKU67429.1 AraC family transcriptional regulator [Parabacteroides sp. AF17-3]
MSNLEKSAEDYLSRINSVILYIEKNLDKVLSLDVVSRHANFSPFHFHRIFTALIGETLADFVLRLRTEKAAKLLQEDKNIPIVEIAYKCGFTNQTSFSRAFRKSFSMTAHEFRKKEKAVFSSNKQFYNSLGKLIERTESTIKHQQPASSILEKISFIQNANIQIKWMPNFNVAYISYIGDFYEIENAYITLFDWAKQNQVLDVSDCRLFTIYHDDSAVTKLEKNRQSVGITMSNNIKVKGKIGKLTISEGKYLVGYFELLGSEYDKAWNTMYLTVMNKGYKFRDAYLYEMYEAKDNDLFSEPYKVYMCLPIE